MLGGSSYVYRGGSINNRHPGNNYMLGGSSYAYRGGSINNRLSGK
jgi:hypothetical protein